MLVKGLKVDIVAWIPIIFCVLGCVSTKDDIPAIARHSFRKRFGIPSVSSGGSYGLVELERDEVVKERNNWSDFILDTHREPKERVDGWLESSGGIRTHTDGGNAIGNSGKSTHGYESRGITKSTLLEALSPRHCDFEESKNCNRKERTAEERSIDDVAESEPFFAESKERQRRGAKVNRRVTDEKIFFPESSTQTTLSSRRKNQPNKNTTPVVGGNQSGSTGGEGGDGVDTYFLSKTPIHCPSGYQLLKERCRAVRE